MNQKWDKKHRGQNKQKVRLFYQLPIGKIYFWRVLFVCLWIITVCPTSVCMPYLYRINRTMPRLWFLWTNDRTVWCRLLPPATFQSHWISKYEFIINIFAVSPISRYHRYLYVCATAQRNLLNKSPMVCFFFFIFLCMSSQSQCLQNNETQQRATDRPE